MRDIRNGITLLELIATISIIAIISIAGIASFKGSAQSDYGAQAEAKKLALELLQAKRRAISTGDNHYIALNSSGGNIVSYQLFRRTGGGDVAVEDLKSIEGNLTISTTATPIEFDFEGQSLATATVTFAGPNRTWQIEVIATTGTARVSEVP